MKQLSPRMKQSLEHLKRGSLAVGNRRLQRPDTYVPSNTARALHARGLVVWFFPPSSNTPYVALSEEGKELVWAR